LLCCRTSLPHRGGTIVLKNERNSRQICGFVRMLYRERKIGRKRESNAGERRLVV
jgi:hypothetical protein